MASKGERSNATQLSTSAIDYSPEYVEILRSLVHDPNMLSKHGYIVQPLSQLELEGYKRCSGCSKPMKSFKRAYPPKEAADIASDALYKDAKKLKEPQEPQQPKELKRRCRFHPGELVANEWTCCSQLVSAEACDGLPDHIPAPSPKDSKIRHLWQCHESPILEVGSTRDIRPAIAIDCEMGTAKSGDNVLIRVTVVDYFTGTPLIDQLVWPDVELLHPNTKYSGVRWVDLHKARRARTCLFGMKNARKAVWNFVGPDTIVVGHGASSDLRSLRWIHTAIVDSFVIEWNLQTPIRQAKIKAAKEKVELERAVKAQAAKEKAELEKAAKAQAETDEAANPTTDGTPSLPDVPPAIPAQENQGNAKPQKKAFKPKGSGDLCLKTLALTKLGRVIQNAGKAGHDSFEDAVAARDLVHWYICNSPTLSGNAEHAQSGKMASLLN